MTVDNRAIKQFNHYVFKVKQFSGNSWSELTNIDGKACNNIPEAVNMLALSASLGNSYETGWNNPINARFVSTFNIISEKLVVNNFLCKYFIKQLNPPFSYSTRWKSLFKEALATILNTFVLITRSNKLQCSLVMDIINLFYHILIVDKAKILPRHKCWQ